MADKNKSEAKSESTSTKSSPKTQKHELITDVPIGKEVMKKGTSYPLTEKGRKYFKSQNYIK